jgi:hypothetical protein
VTTLNDVARRAGVSKSTVSNVIRGDIPVAKAGSVINPCDFLLAPPQRRGRNGDHASELIGVMLNFQLGLIDRMTNVTTSQYQGSAHRLRRPVTRGSESAQPQAYVDTKTNA